MACFLGKHYFKWACFYGNLGLPCQFLLLSTTILTDVLHQDSLYVPSCQAKKD